MSPSLRLPSWHTTYRTAEGHERTFRTQAATLTAHLALLALEPDYSPSRTAEHELCWDTPRAV